jgi:hypothetical protein
MKTIYTLCALTLVVLAGHQHPRFETTYVVKHGATLYYTDYVERDSSGCVRFADIKQPDTYLTFCKDYQVTPFTTQRP